MVLRTPTTLISKLFCASSKTAGTSCSLIPTPLAIQSGRRYRPLYALQVFKVFQFCGFAHVGSIVDQDIQSSISKEALRFFCSLFQGFVIGNVCGHNVHVRYVVGT